jgi:hypothetical protein
MVINVNLVRKITVRSSATTIEEVAEITWYNNRPSNQIQPMLKAIKKKRDKYRQVKI